MFPEAKRVKVNLDSFLKAPSFTLDGVTATVKDLIQACANAKGGVHFGSAKTSEKVLYLIGIGHLKLLVKNLAW